MDAKNCHSSKNCLFSWLQLLKTWPELLSFTRERYWTSYWHHKGPIPKVQVGKCTLEKGRASLTIARMTTGKRNPMEASKELCEKHASRGGQERALQRLRAKEEIHCHLIRTAEDGHVLLLTRLPHRCWLCCAFKPSSLQSPSSKSEVGKPAWITIALHISHWNPMAITAWHSSSLCHHFYHFLEFGWLFL